MTTTTTTCKSPTYQGYHGPTDSCKLAHTGFGLEFVVMLACLAIAVGIILFKLGRR